MGGFNHPISLCKYLSLKFDSHHRSLKRPRYQIISIDDIKFPEPCGFKCRSLDTRRPPEGLIIAEFIPINQPEEPNNGLHNFLHK